MATIKINPETTYSTFNSRPLLDIKLPIAVQTNSMSFQEVTNIMDLLTEKFTAGFSFSKESHIEVVKELHSKIGSFGYFNQQFITLRINFRNQLVVGYTDNLEGGSTVFAPNQLTEISDNIISINY